MEEESQDEETPHSPPINACKPTGPTQFWDMQQIPMEGT